MADWIDKYPQVKALLQDADTVLEYTPDAPLPSPAAGGRSVLRGLYTDWVMTTSQGPADPASWEGPSPLYERYYPPLDLSPRLPLTWAMVEDVWPQLVRQVLVSARLLGPP